MHDWNKTIRERCHVNTNEDGDDFVGVKADSTGIIIYFPIGYHLPDDDDELRMDIHNLFGVLAAFMKEDPVIEKPKFPSSRSVDFPMHAYLKVIRHFLRTGRYYVETAPLYKTDTKGKTSWSRTVKRQAPLIQKDGSFIFINRTVRSSTPDVNQKMTQIHRYCVYEAFDKLGILYVPYLPENPGPHPSVKESICILTNKLASTYNDDQQELFSAMRDMLLYQDENGDQKEYFFGTSHFETIWERMIDKAFGITDKETYFPRTRWLLDHGADKERTPLYPDSIMVYRNKFYVLDAKYYRYGRTANPNHLPNGTDINKQITYGEYIESTRNIPNERLFNAFIMPFNQADNLFGLTEHMGNIGEAVGDWRFDARNLRMKNFERIQGIVMDTRYLMYNYTGSSEQMKRALAECIERISQRGEVPPPKPL